MKKTSPDPPQSKRLPTIYLGIGLLIILIAGLLRYWNIATNPGWYSDEGTLVEIAKNLLEGKSQYLVFNKSTLLAARLPLFPMMLAGVFSFTGVHITILRYLTAGLGVLTTALIIASIRDILGEKGEYLSLAAGFMMAVYPRGVLSSRLGFSYNLLAPLVIGVLWAIYKYLEDGRRDVLLIASLLTGMGTVSDVMMFTLVPALFLIVIYTNWKDLPWLLLGSFFPFLVYASVMFLNHPAAFLFDFKFTFFRLGSIPLIAQYPIIIFNYTALLAKDYWWTAGIAGMFLLQDRKLKYLTLILFLVPLFGLGRTAALPGLGFYYLIPLFPLLALGAGSFFVTGLRFVFNNIRDGVHIYLERLSGNFPDKFLTELVRPGVFLLTSLLLFVIVVSPLVMETAMGFSQAKAGITSDIDAVLVNAADAEEARSYVNSRVGPEDLVLASPALAWGLDANAADFQMALAYQGQETLHFPRDIPSDRYSFAPDVQQAAYVIVDPIWTNWAAVNISGVERMLDQVRTWPLAYQAGAVVVYKNPNR